MTNDDNTTIDRSSIDSDRLTENMLETIDEAMALLREYDIPDEGSVTLIGPEEPVTREDCYFDCEEEDVLYDAWQMLRYCGLSKDELKPLTLAIEADTIYEERSLDWYFENIVLEYKE